MRNLLVSTLLLTILFGVCIVSSTPPRVDQEAIDNAVLKQKQYDDQVHSVLSEHFNKLLDENRQLKEELAELKANQ